MTRALPISLALAALALPATAPAATATADAFGRRIPPVSGQLHTKAGRFEITPTANLSFNDAFFSKYFFGGKLGYHFTERLSLSAAFSGGFASATGSTEVCPANEGCRDATDAQLNQVPGELNSIAGLEVAFAPVYGKLNAFAEQVLHFDLSVLAGADWFRYRGVLPAVEANAGAEPGTDSTFGGHVGLGARIFLGRSMALRLEVKDYLYRVSVLGEDTLQNQLFAELGVSLFLPSGRREAR